MSVHDEPWYREEIAKAERGNRAHIAKYARSFNGIMAKSLADGDDGDTGADTEKADSIRAHPVVHLARLLVASGKFSDHGAALHHILNTSSGAALLHRTRTHKGETMSTPETLASILKNFGPTKICQHIVDAGQTGYSELALTMALSKHVGGDRAFAKLYQDEIVVRQAVQVAAKAMPDLTPLVVGGPDATHEAVDSTESSEAYQQLEAMASRLRATSPWLSAEQAFARVFEEPKNVTLAAKAHRRPTAPASGMYPYPR
jgi:hypothetical protein